MSPEGRCCLGSLTATSQPEIEEASSSDASVWWGLMYSRSNSPLPSSLSNDTDGGLVTSEQPPGGSRATIEAASSELIMESDGLWENVCAGFSLVGHADSLCRVRRGPDPYDDGGVRLLSLSLELCDASELALSVDAPLKRWVCIGLRDKSP